MTNTEVISILRRYSDLQSPERVDRSMSQLQTLGLLEPPGLIAVLGDSNPNIRLLAVEILSDLDPIEASLPALINALEDPDQLVRIAAVDPLARFGRKAHAAIPVLNKWLEDEREYIRLTAAAAICRIEPEQIPKLLAVLMTGLESNLSLDQRHAAAAIGNLGAAGAPALSVLGRMLGDDSADVRCDAANAIWGITGDPTISIRVGVDLLGAEDWLERYVGVKHLGMMGPVAKPALSDLRRFLSGDDLGIQTVVATAIERIEGP